MDKGARKIMMMRSSQRWIKGKESTNEGMEILLVCVATVQLASDG